MAKKINYIKEFTKILEELKEAYPNQSFTWHIELATADYPSISGMSEKEMLFALQKYQAECALDIQNIVPEDYVQRIQEDAEHLFDRQADDWENEF